MQRKIHAIPGARRRKRKYLTHEQGGIKGKRLGKTIAHKRALGAMLENGWGETKTGMALASSLETHSWNDQSLKRKEGHLVPVHEAETEPKAEGPKHSIAKQVR